MRGMWAFLKENIFEVGAALGGLFSAIITISTFYSTKQGEKVDSQFSVDESYERVWSKHNGNPDLKRITLDKADLKREPVTLEEERFILLLLNHVTSTMKAINRGKYDKPDGMELDVTTFFQKPIPNAVATKFFNVQSKEIQKLLSEVVKNVEQEGVARYPSV